MDKHESVVVLQGEQDTKQSFEWRQGGCSASVLANKAWAAWLWLGSLWKSLFLVSMWTFQAIRTEEYASVCPLASDLWLWGQRCGTIWKCGSNTHTTGSCDETHQGSRRGNSTGCTSTGPGLWVHGVNSTLDSLLYSIKVQSRVAVSNEDWSLVKTLVNTENVSHALWLGPYKQPHIKTVCNLKP